MLEYKWKNSKACEKKSNSLVRRKKDQPGFSSHLVVNLLHRWTFDRSEEIVILLESTTSFALIGACRDRDELISSIIYNHSTPRWNKGILEKALESLFDLLCFCLFFSLLKLFFCSSLSFCLSDCLSDCDEIFIQNSVNHVLKIGSHLSSQTKISQWLTTCTILLHNPDQGDGGSKTNIVRQVHMFSHESKEQFEIETDKFQIANHVLPFKKQKNWNWERQILSTLLCVFPY